MENLNICWNDPAIKKITDVLSSMREHGFTELHPTYSFVREATVGYNNPDISGFEVYAHVDLCAYFVRKEVNKNIVVLVTVDYINSLCYIVDLVTVGSARKIEDEEVRGSSDPVLFLYVFIYFFFC